MEEDNLELYEKREHEVLERLGMTEFDDQNRKALVNELNVLSSIRNTYEQTDQTRLNNNAKISIDEAKLVIEQEKIRNDKERTKMMLLQAILSFGGGAFLTWKSYHMDENGYSYKDLKNFAMRQIDRIRGK